MSETSNDRQKLKTLLDAFKAVASGKNIQFAEPRGQPYVRLFFLPSFFNFGTLGFSNFLRHFSNALEGGIYMGHPKFGEADILAAGWRQTLKGKRGPYFDLYPEERLEGKSSATVCAELIRDQRLLAQMERDGVTEVHTSFGEAVALSPRRIQKAPDHTVPAQPESFKIA